MRTPEEKAAYNKAYLRADTVDEWLEKCALLGNICIYCGEAKPLTIDHKVPLCRGGRNDITNIVPACQSCNSKKGRRTTAEYLALKVA